MWGSLAPPPQGVPPPPPAPRAPPAPPHKGEGVGLLVDRFAELAAARFGGRRLVVVAQGMQPDDLGRLGLLRRRQRPPWLRTRLTRLARRAAGPRACPPCGPGFPARSDPGL